MAQATHSPSANTDAVNTYAAVGGVAHELVGVQYSYLGAAPTGGNLKVESPSGTIVWQAGIKLEDADSFTFDTVSVKGAVGEALIVTLAAAGASCSGKLNSQTRA